jgi:hypothetical protein
MSSTIRRYRRVWIGLSAVVVAVAGVAVAVWRRRSAVRRLDVGAVSEGWLAQQRGSRES